MIIKRNFSTTTRLRTDKKDIVAKTLELIEERERLLEDKDMVYKHMVAITKEEFGNEPNEEQKKSVFHIKETYPEFFEQDSENEDTPTNSLNQSVESKEREQLGHLKTYIKTELKANIDQHTKTVQDNPELFTEQGALKPEYLVDYNKTSDASHQETYSEKTNSENKPAATKEESSRSVNDFIDNLPNDYNPFDDIGSD